MRKRNLKTNKKVIKLNQICTLSQNQKMNKKVKILKLKKNKKNKTLLSLPLNHNLNLMKKKIQLKNLSLPVKMNI
jgi:hypothetical protein